MSHQRRIVHISVALALICVALAGGYLSGCADYPRPEPNGIAAHADPIALARRELALLVIEPEHAEGYRREDWPHWRQGRRNCINVREEVLIAQSRQPVEMSADGCSVVGGVWEDFYSDKVFTDPRRLDIDHLVPLEEANQSGGWAWNRERRADYANDLSTGFSLLAVSAEANRSKGSKGPEDWLPRNTEYKCIYVIRWVTIKAKWRLSIDQREHDNIAQELDSCTH